MSGWLWLGLIASVGFAAVALFWFWLATDLDDFFDRINRDDAKAADVGAGGGGAEIERPSEHNRTS